MENECLQFRLSGLTLLSGTLGKAAHGAKEALVRSVNSVSGVDLIALAYGEITSGGNCHARGGRVECDGAWGFSGRPWTFGDVVMNTSNGHMSDTLFEHESKHSAQWAALGGWGFVPAYAGDLLVEGRCNSFEHQAGYGSGGYNDLPNPCQPQSAAACLPNGHVATEPR